MGEDKIRLVLDEYNSSFITYELEPGIYTFNDLSETLFKILQSEFEGIKKSIAIDFDHITMKNKLVVRPGIIAIKFNENSFCCTVLGFNHGWDYKHYIEYISQNIAYLSTTNKLHLKCDVIDGSVVNGIQKTILFRFILDKPAGYKVFCEPETINYKKNKQICFEHNNILFSR